MTADRDADMAALTERFDATLAAVRAAQVVLAQSSNPQDAALRVEVIGILEEMISAMASARVLGRIEAENNMLEILQAQGRDTLLAELEDGQTFH